MFLSIRTIARHEVLALQRQKTFTLLLAIFLTMTLFSTYIGWSTRHTILAVYNETVHRMAAAGAGNIPANPFLALQPLSILKNMVIYILLIGSLLAIVVGNRAFIRDRRAGVIKVLFSRPVSRLEFVLGKTAGMFLILSAIMAASFMISLISSSLLAGRLLHGPDILRLFIFYLISLEYLMVFAMLGFLFSMTSRSESMALMSSVMVWILISFVLPQLNSALDPASLLNPTTIQAAFPQSHFFTSVREFITPFSISENYKTMGRMLLEGNTFSSSLGPSLAFLVLLSAACVKAIKNFNLCEEGITE